MADNELSFENAYLDEDGTIWFASMYFNGLFSYDIKRDNLMLRGFYKGEPLYGKYLYSGAVKYNNKLFFPPYRADSIGIYSIEDNTFSNIVINNYGYKSQKIYGMAQYNNMLYMFGGYIPAIVCLNMDTHEVTYITDVYLELEKRQRTDIPYRVARTVISIGSKCIFASRRSGDIVEYNLEDNTYNVYEVIPECNGITALIKVGDELLIIPEEPMRLALWNMSTKELKYIDRGSETEKNAVSYSFEWNGGVYLLPMRGVSAYKWCGESTLQDVENKIIYYDEGVSEAELREYNQQRISWADVVDGVPYYFSNVNKSLYRFTEAGSQFVKKMVLDDETYCSITRRATLRQQMDQAQIIQEKDENSLSEFIHELTEG